MNALIALKSRYFEAIKSGRKVWELRRRAPKVKPGDWLVVKIYQTL